MSQVLTLDAMKCVAQTGLRHMFCEHMFDNFFFVFLAEEIYQTSAVIIENYVPRLV